MWIAVSILGLIVTILALWYWDGHRRGMLRLRRMGLNDAQIDAGHLMILAFRDLERRMSWPEFPSSLLLPIAFKEALGLHDVEVQTCRTNPAYALSTITAAVAKHRRSFPAQPVPTESLDW